MGMSVTRSSWFDAVIRHGGLDPRWPRYAQNTADASNSSALDPVVSRNQCLGKICGIDPDIVLGAVRVQETGMCMQVPFELPAIHGGIFICVTWIRTIGA